MRLIDANEIEELFYKQVEYGATDLMDAFDDALQDAQTIEAEPVRYGRWIAREYDDGFGPYKMYHCSECDTREAKKEKYCRECGVRMFLGGTYGEEQ